MEVTEKEMIVRIDPMWDRKFTNNLMPSGVVYKYMIGQLTKLSSLNP